VSIEFFLEKVKSSLLFIKLKVYLGLIMLSGALILWAVLTVLSFIFVVYDLIKNTPEAGVMKIGWALVVFYTGPVGLFFYFMTCREPMPRTHEKFIDSLWKQATGSEVHCLAGDATGIIIMAIILSFYEIPRGVEIFLEYIAGFVSGLLIFQALFMKKMMGGTYVKALKTSFYPEWLSMNMIMAGMIPVMVIWGVHDPLARNPGSLHFWGMMSLATIVGGVVAYPINRWLVAKGLKHGMMTVRKGEEMEKGHHDASDHSHMKHEKVIVTQSQIYKALIISLVGLAIGIIIAIVGAYL